MVVGDFMTRFYLIRHCEAMGNVLRLFQGSSDLDISELGAKQLEFLKKRFSEVHIDKVYSSPLIRAVKTARAVVGDRDLSVETCDGLIELHGGVVEGKPFEEAFNSIEGLADTWDNHPQDFAPEGGESMRHAYERIWETVCKIVLDNKGKTIVASSHGGVIRCLVCRLLENDINRLKDINWSENTAVMLIEFDDNFNAKLVYFNDYSHLPEEFVNRKTRLASFMRGDAK